MGTVKYRASTAERFIDLYSTGLYTLSEMCAAVDITTSTYYLWRNKMPGFAQRLAEAEKQRTGALREMAVKGLVKLLTERDVTEVHTTETPDGYIRKTIEKKELPDVRAVLTTLQKTDPAFKDIPEATAGRVTINLTLDNGCDPLQPDGSNQ